MRIKMLKTSKGSLDGLEVRTFKEGEVYDVSDTLAKTFIDSKNAEESSEDVSVTRYEQGLDAKTPGRAPKQPAPRKVEVERAPLGKGDPNAEVIRPLENLPQERRVTQTFNSELSRDLAEQEKAMREMDEENAQKADNKRSTKALKSSDYDNKSKKAE